MKAIPITYRYGHLYKTETGERIALSDNSEFLLITQYENQITIEEFKAPDKTRTGDQIKASLVARPDVTHVRLLAQQDQHLYFSIIAASQTYWFQMLLLEDLFIYTSRSFKDEKTRLEGRLWDCHCVVDKITAGELPHFEKVYSNSISSVVKKCHIQYFGNLGSPNKNAFDSVFRSPSKAEPLQRTRGFTVADAITR